MFNSWYVVPPNKSCRQEQQRCQIYPPPQAPHHGKCQKSFSRWLPFNKVALQCNGVEKLKSLIPWSRLRSRVYRFEGVPMQWSCWRQQKNTEIENGLIWKKQQQRSQHNIFINMHQKSFYLKSNIHIWKKITHASF